MLLRGALTGTLPITRAYFYRSKHHSCRLLVVGAGAGGCAVAAKFARQLKKDEIIVIEPSDKHFYQPLFTLVGGGVCKLDQTYKLMKDVLPTNAKWIKDQAVEFLPLKNQVRTKEGDTIEYEYMVVAVGLQTNYEKIPGLVQGLEMPGGVCSNYSYKYVERTFKALQDFKGGNAIFTFPNSPVKCPGAPQKICYISEHYLRNHNLRDKAQVIYNTSLPVIFGVKVYAKALWEVCKKRNIQVNLRTNLIEVKPDTQEAVFENLDKPGEKTTLKYSMLHVTPPMSAPNEISKNKELANAAGFVEVKPDTLQHVRFPNIFAIGDCSSSPNSKTAAAAAAQCIVVYKNLDAVMNNKALTQKYDGYASCPLVTSYNTCILAEFDYSLQPLETFPFRQDKELHSMYYLKKTLMPPLYWNLMLNGYWNGPAAMRNLMHFKFK